MITIIPATKDHIEQVAPLFDRYRIFYGQDSNLSAATRFLEQRMSRNESVIFLALDEQEAVGFTQLYTTFSSVSMERVFILNDLFVLNSHRKKGIGEALLNRAKTHCKERGYKGLALETATNNPAQQLYERLGWKKDAHCFHYFWTA
ncbi:GNAT family N-acetyltransferase [Flavobacteriaceae bacterium TP-CH-4]|uniref:GNAT family N-acetyltransferase n=1 Tax=Pelagihabitans pacificus TaxID=2696054 RepID=A0A967AS83_9FLAO|nr:GNAT family N-acetyltransferase [Pelagihabitans pacificus]NHF59333.1 GNAT family N-acetyltransferase [Pelagihabitans pacificus]